MEYVGKQSEDRMNGIDLHVNCSMFWKSHLRSDEWRMYMKKKKKKKKFIYLVIGL